MAGAYALMGLKRSNPEVKRVTKMAFDRTSSCLFIKAEASDIPIFSTWSIFWIREGRRKKKGRKRRGVEGEQGTVAAALRLRGVWTLLIAWKYCFWVARQKVSVPVSPRHWRLVWKESEDADSLTRSTTTTHTEERLHRRFISLQIWESLEAKQPDELICKSWYSHSWVLFFQSLLFLSSWIYSNYLDSSERGQMVPLVTCKSITGCLIGLASPVPSPHPLTCSLKDYNPAAVFWLKKRKKKRNGKESEWWDKCLKT